MDLDHLPTQHRAFVERAVPLLEDDPRVVGVTAGGSFVTGGMDEFSDVDLVIAVAEADYEAVLEDRRKIAASLGNLVGAFTGEHVGEPRVLICLYGPEPLHVDLKFVTVEAAAERIEDSAILFDRQGELSAAFTASPPQCIEIDLQWIEDRFWIWIHYGATKIGRGELFEAIDFLAFLRMQVLGPLALRASGAPPIGVRKIETLAPDYADSLQATVSEYDAISCGAALDAAANLYRQLRDEIAPEDLIRGRSAETLAVEYLAAVREN